MQRRWIAAIVSSSLLAALMHGGPAAHALGTRPFQSTTCRFNVVLTLSPGLVNGGDVQQTKDVYAGRLKRCVGGAVTGGRVRGSRGQNASGQCGGFLDTGLPITIRWNTGERSKGSGDLQWSNGQGWYGGTVNSGKFSGEHFANHGFFTVTFLNGDCNDPNNRVTRIRVKGSIDV